MIPDRLRRIATSEPPAGAARLADARQRSRAVTVVAEPVDSPREALLLVGGCSVSEAS